MSDPKREAVLGADQMTREERMARALAWFDEALAREKAAGPPLVEAREALWAAEQAAHTATVVRKNCMDAINCAVMNADYCMGGRPWAPPWAKDGGE